MAYIKLFATLVQDPTRSRLLWVQKTTNVNDYLYVFKSQIERFSKIRGCIAIPTGFNSNTPITKNHCSLEKGTDT